MIMMRFQMCFEPSFKHTCVPIAKILSIFQKRQKLKNFFIQFFFDQIGIYFNKQFFQNEAQTFKLSGSGI